MDYICPECGYTDEARGRCPSCEVPLIPIDEVGEATKDEAEPDEDSEQSDS